MTSWYSITAVPAEGKTTGDVKEALDDFAKGVTEGDREPNATVYDEEVYLDLSTHYVDVRVTISTNQSKAMRKKIKRALKDDARLVFFIRANDTADSAKGSVYENDDGSWSQVKNEFTYPDARGGISHKLSYDGIKPVTRR